MLGFINFVALDRHGLLMGFGGICAEFGLRVRSLNAHAEPPDAIVLAVVEGDSQDIRAAMTAVRRRFKASAFRFRSGVANLTARHGTHATHRVNIYAHDCRGFLNRLLAVVAEHANIKLDGMWAREREHELAVLPDVHRCLLYVAARNDNAIHRFVDHLHRAMHEVHGFEARIRHVADLFGPNWLAQETTLGQFADRSNRRRFYIAATDRHGLGADLLRQVREQHCEAVGLRGVVSSGSHARLVLDCVGQDAELEALDRRLERECDAHAHPNTFELAEMIRHERASDATHAIHFDGSLRDAEALFDELAVAHVSFRRLWAGAVGHKVDSAESMWHAHGLVAPVDIGDQVDDLHTMTRAAHAMATWAHRHGVSFAMPKIDDDPDSLARVLRLAA